MNPFINKRILLVCKETFSYPLYFLSQEWEKNNTVAAFFFNPCETKYAECMLNKSTYYAYKRRGTIRMYTSDDIADEFTRILKSEELMDEEYLRNLETHYSHFANINQQIVSSQFLTRHYHFRNYIQSCTYNQQLNWLMLNYQNIIKIIDEFRPDVIVDCDTAELARCILLEVSYKKSIPYITIEYPRYEFYKIYSYNLNLKMGNLFEETYRRHLANVDSLNKAIEYIGKFRQSNNIMSDIYKNDITAQYDPTPIKKAVSSLVGKINYFVKQDITGDNYAVKKANPILYPSSYEYIKFYIRVEYIRQRLMRRNKFFTSPVKGEKYVYMPLHLIPESTTFTLSPMYINELTVIQAISKSLPAGWWLYVKEHQSMLGERGIEFYESINKLPNVRLVQLNYYRDPKPWIVNSQGVITLSGTSAYEAALLGKPSAVFSDVIFSVINSVKRVRSFEDLPAIFQSFKEPVDNEISCAAYIATVEEIGYPIDLKHLMRKGQAILENGETTDSSFNNSLNNLKKLYEDAFDNFLKNKNA